MYLINLLAWSGLLALVSYVYCSVLTDGGMLLNKWYNYLFDTIGPASKKPKLWLYKPLIGCYKCVAGQFALWGYFWFIWKFSMNYDLAFHIVFISFAIYIVKFIKQAYEWK